MKNVNQLIDDIDESMKAGKELYRVGTLILHKHVKDEKVVYDIVDGQQRTITFVLLLNYFGEKVPFLQREITYNSYSIQNVSNNSRTIKSPRQWRKFSSVGASFLRAVSQKQIFIMTALTVSR